MENVKQFLVTNGFKKLELNSFANDLCNVVIEEDHYVVADNQGNTMYSKDHNIYWLIGVLTYYNFIAKNYKALNISSPF